VLCRLIVVECFHQNQQSQSGHQRVCGLQNQNVPKKVPRARVPPMARTKLATFVGCSRIGALTSVCPFKAPVSRRLFVCLAFLAFAVIVAMDTLFGKQRFLYCPFSAPGAPHFGVPFFVFVYCLKTPVQYLYARRII